MSTIATKYFELMGHINRAKDEMDLIQSLLNRPAPLSSEEESTIQWKFIEVRAHFDRAYAQVPSLREETQLLAMKGAPSSPEEPNQLFQVAVSLECFEADAPQPSWDDIRHRITQFIADRRFLAIQRLQGLEDQFRKKPTIS